MALSLEDLENILAVTERCLDDSLRRPRYRDNPNLLAGQCYVMAEAIYHMIGGTENVFGLKPMQVSHEGDSHWFLATSRVALGEKTVGFVVVDPTVSQFTTPVPYEAARGKGFLTKKPSRRALILIQRVKDWIALKD